MSAMHPIAAIELVGLREAATDPKQPFTIGRRFLQEIKKPRVGVAQDSHSLSHVRPCSLIVRIVQEVGYRA